jgi:hypothetical protein
MKENAFTLKMTNLNKNMKQLKKCLYNRIIKYEKSNKHMILLALFINFNKINSFSFQLESMFFAFGLVQKDVKNNFGLLT